MSEVSHLNSSPQSENTRIIHRLVSCVVFARLSMSCFCTWFRLWKSLSPSWESLTRRSHLLGFTVKPWYEWGLCKNKLLDCVAALQGVSATRWGYVHYSDRHPDVGWNASQKKKQEKEVFVVFFFFPISLKSLQHKRAAFKEILCSALGVSFT